MMETYILRTGKYMKHKDKIKLAKKMMTKEERRTGVSPFQSVSWEARYQSKLAKVKREMEAARERKKLKALAS